MDGKTVELVMGNGTLTDPGFLGRVGAALDQAVVDVRTFCTGRAGLWACGYYAMAGADLLNLLSGFSLERFGYLPQFGSLAVRAGPNGRRVFLSHGWIIRHHGAASMVLEGDTLLREGRRDRLEIIDFSARFYPEYARAVGIPWTEPLPPPQLAGWAEELAARGVVFEPAQQLTVARVELWRAEGDLVIREIVGRALAIEEGLAVEPVRVSRQLRRARARDEAKRAAFIARGSAYRARR